MTLKVITFFSFLAGRKWMTKAFSVKLPFRGVRSPHQALQQVRAMTSAKKALGPMWDHDLAEWVKSHLFPFEYPHRKVPYMPPASGTTPVRAIWRGTVQTNTYGVGWIAFAPSYAYDDPCIAYSGSTGVLQVIDTADTGTQTATLAGSPYAMADFTTSGTETTPSQRIMPRWGKCAFRIQNVSPSEKRGGDGFIGCVNGGMETSDNIGENQYMTLKQQGAIQDIDVNGAWNEFVPTPIGDDDYKFGPNPYYRPSFAMTTKYNTSGGVDYTQRQPCLPCFAWWIAASGDAASYLVEIVFDFDFMQPGVGNTAGASFANQASNPTPVPQHNPGALALAQALFHARNGQPDAAHRSHHGRASQFVHGVGRFFKSLGHDIAKPLDDAIEGVAAGIGLGGTAGALDAAGAALSWALL